MSHDDDNSITFPKMPKEEVSIELLRKRQKNSEAARRCREKVKNRLETLERENKELLAEKREIYMKLVQTESMLEAQKNIATKATEKVDVLEQRLAQFQKYILVNMHKEKPSTTADQSSDSHI